MCSLRSLSTALVMEEMYRGTPVIYVDLHRLRRDRPPLGAGAWRDARRARRRRRPGRAAGQGSRGRTTAVQVRPACRDHGQSLGATFKQRYGETLQDVIAAAHGRRQGRRRGDRPRRGVGPDQRGRDRGVAQPAGPPARMTRVALRDRTEDGAIDLAPDKESATGATTMARRPPTSRPSWSSAPAATWP